MRAKICNGLMLLMGIVLMGCETTLDFDVEGMDRKVVLAVLADPDTVVMADVSFSNLRESVQLSIDELDFWEYYTSPELVGEFISNIILSADVTLVLNGDKAYSMAYNEESYRYVSDYRPSEGDVLRVTVDNNGTIAEGETWIPSPVRLDVISVEKRRDEMVFNPEAIEFSGIDSVAVITMRIHDPGDEENYYRLKVRSMGTKNKTFQTYAYSDLFHSEDMLFFDPEFEKGFGGWDAYFSNVFDDTLIDGKEYTFTVTSRMLKGTDPAISIELQSLTRDLYYYLRSMMTYRISTVDVTGEAIRIHSNVENGFGIVGALNGDNHLIDLNTLTVLY